MGKWDGVREAQGVHDAQGVKAIIFDIEKGETGENAQNPGLLMFTVHLRIIEPPSVEGYEMRDWFTIGVPGDKKAKKDETWKRSEGGPGRLARLMKRAGVDPTDDDEEWMDALIDKEVCFHMTQVPNRNGAGMQNRVGLYFRENDDDFVGVGEPLADDAKGKGGRGGRSAKGGDTRANGPERPSARKAKDEEEEERPSKRKAVPQESEDDDEEDEAPKSPRGRAVARRQADPDED